MTSIEPRRTRAAPVGREFSADDMQCMSPPGQNWAVISCVHSNLPGRADGKEETRFAVAIYGVFATIEEARQWDHTLTKHGMVFQTYIVPTNVALSLPPPKDESQMERRYADEKLDELMKSWTEKQTRLDANMEKRLEELREKELAARVEKLKYERDNSDEADISEGLRAHRKTLAGKSDADLTEMAKAHLAKTNAAAASGLPKHRPEEAHSVGPGQTAALPPPPRATADQFRLADLGPAPTTEEESKRFVEEYKRTGRKIVCKLGQPVVCSGPPPGAAAGSDRGVTGLPKISEIVEDEEKKQT